MEYTPGSEQQPNSYNRHAAIASILHEKYKRISGYETLIEPSYQERFNKKFAQQADLVDDVLELFIAIGRQPTAIAMSEQSMDDRKKDLEQLSRAVRSIQKLIIQQGMCEMDDADISDTQKNEQSSDTFNLPIADKKRNILGQVLRDLDVCSITDSTLDGVVEEIGVEFELGSLSLEDKYRLYIQFKPLLNGRSLRYESGDKDFKDMRPDEFQIIQHVLKTFVLDVSQTQAQ